MSSRRGQSNRDKYEKDDDSDDEDVESEDEEESDDDGGNVDTVRVDGTATRGVSARRAECSRAAASPDGHVCGKGALRCNGLNKTLLCPDYRVDVPAYTQLWADAGQRPTADDRIGC